MESDKKYFGTFTDISERYTINIKVLKEVKQNGKTLPAKFSIEISSKNNPKDIRSYRHTSKTDIENLIVELIRAYAYFLTELGFFRDIDKSPLKHLDLELSISDFSKPFFNKIKLAMHDGVKLYYEK